jgi:hypothetical protein
MSGQVTRSNMKTVNNKGKVILIGAGSGDPELITVKGAVFCNRPT